MPLFEKYKKWVVIAVVVLIVLGFGLAYYFYEKYQAVKANPTGEAQAAAQAEVAGLVTEVGKLMVLPADETPTVATVADASKVQDQKFFANAANGDKLLAYTKAMEAILYRPSANKIISVAPIVINNTATSTATSQTTSNK
jgi:hypothetical protein